MWFLYAVATGCVIVQISLFVFVDDDSASPQQKNKGERPDMPALRSRGQTDMRWMSLHDEYVNIARKTKNLDVIFFGDSITLHWINMQSWKSLSSMYKIKNFGIGGDRTQHVLWRMDHGELDFAQAPQVLVLMIGTNNLDSDEPQDIAEGAFQATDRIRERLKHTKIILVGIPPRSKFPNNKIRLKGESYNRILKERAQKKGIEFIEFPVVVNEDGVFEREFTTDFVHLTNKAYDRLAESVNVVLMKSITKR